MIVCSKTTTQILAWMVLFAVMFEAVPYNLSYIFSGNYWIVVAGDIIAPAALFLLPLGGILGDVYWGRYKTVVCGMALIALSMFITSVGSMLAISKEGNSFYGLVLTLMIVAFLLSIFGFSFFGSNIPQFALDQLMDKPSESLGMFAHWMAWAFSTGQVIVDVFSGSANCMNAKIARWFVHAKLILYSFLSVVFLLVAYCTRHHFNRDRVKYNPYKMIFKVLNFARKNKYPVGPVSAFTHCYDFRPSRLDYAKERYGGPFTTSDVEDVKTFKNVFFLLISFGLFFVLEVPTSSFLSNTLSAHAGDGIFVGKSQICEEKLNTGNLSKLSTVIVFPIYIWFIYCVLQSRPPKILHRLIIAVSLFILSVVSMLVIDLAGHVALYTQTRIKHNQCACLLEMKIPNKI